MTKIKNPATAQGVVAGKSLQPDNGAKIKKISDNTETGNNADANTWIPDWGNIEVSEFDGAKCKQAKFDCSLEEVVKIAQGDREALLFFGNVGKKMEDYRKINQSAINFRRTLPKIRNKITEYNKEGWTSKDAKTYRDKLNDTTGKGKWKGIRPKIDDVCSGKTDPEVIADALEQRATDLKLALPAITPGKRVPVGMGRAGKGKDYKIVPVCQIDVDKCGKENIPDVIEVLKGCPDVLLLAKSPSGDGVKGLLYLGRDAAKDADTYKVIAKEKTQAIEKRLQPLLASIEEAILEKDPEGEVPKFDKSKLNPNDLMFLTVADADDELYINYNDVMTGEAEDKIENACEGRDDAATNAQGDYPHKGIPTGRGS